MKTEKQLQKLRLRIQKLQNRRLKQFAKIFKSREYKEHYTALDGSVKVIFKSGAIMNFKGLLVGRAIDDGLMR